MTGAVLVHSRLLEGRDFTVLLDFDVVVFLKDLLKHSCLNVENKALVARPRELHLLVLVLLVWFYVTLHAPNH